MDIGQLSFGDSQSNHSQENQEKRSPTDNNCLGDEYFDVESVHCLMPLLPTPNSHNRNMVLSISHGGVKYILDRVAKFF